MVGLCGLTATGCWPQSNRLRGARDNSTYGSVPDLPFTQMCQKGHVRSTSINRSRNRFPNRLFIPLLYNTEHNYKRILCAGLANCNTLQVSERSLGGWKLWQRARWLLKRGVKHNPGMTLNRCGCFWLADRSCHLKEAFGMSNVIGLDYPDCWMSIYEDVRVTL